MIKSEQLEDNIRAQEEQLKRYKALAEQNKHFGFGYIFYGGLVKNTEEYIEELKSLRAVAVK